MRDFQRENILVLNLVQAMIGAVSPNFNTVWLRIIDAEDPNSAVELNFCLDEESAEDRKEIADILAEFEALQTSALVLDCRIHINDGSYESLPDARLVFKRKKPES